MTVICCRHCAEIKNHVVVCGCLAFGSKLKVFVVPSRASSIFQVEHCQICRGLIPLC